MLYPSKSAHPSGRATVRINQYHPMYDPTAYVLLFPYGDEGCSLPAPLKVDKMVGKKVTELELYRYHIMHRSNSFNTILRGGRLFQEYICDMYCKVESSHLRYYHDNQDTLRCEQYSGIIDAIHAANNKLTELAKVSYCLPLTQDHHVTCMDTILMQWLYAVNSENLISLSQSQATPNGMALQITCYQDRLHQIAQIFRTESSTRSSLH